MKKDCVALEELVKSHDVIYLLMDTRESRWLPTLMCATMSKVCACAHVYGVCARTCAVTYVCMCHAYIYMCTCVYVHL